MSFNTIHPPALADALKNPECCVLIDVRTPGEYQGVHVEGAINLPISTLDPNKVKLLSNKPSTKIYVLCESGGRSKRACETLMAAGVEVINVEGGTSACISTGLPLVRGKGVISIERQVRIVAGSLVVLGVTLGLSVDRKFFGISAFVGSGLVFAGVTNTCGMGMLLAAMPWNNGSKHI
jgi:rhodanese-related sulfurtransferase